MSTVSEPILRGEHSLFRQSWAPRDMRGGGTINADGFGVAWWGPGGTGSRYRNVMPIWTDPAVHEVLGQVESSAVLAAVRSATVGMPVDRSACAPFMSGRWAFSHNGLVPSWREVLGGLATGLVPAHRLALESAPESAGLWLLLRHRVPAAGSAREAVGDELRRLLSAVLARAPDARLNVLLSDGETLWASACYHSLSVLAADDSVVVSSEPYDADPGWQPIPDRHLLTAAPGHLSIEPL